jgi:PAS domain S-box-containing protein
MDNKNVIQTIPQLKSLVAALTELLAVQEQVVSRQSEDLRKNLEALQESREKYRELVETTSDWIWEVDENGVFTYASPRVRDLIGYAPDEVLGKTPFYFMPPEEAARVGEIFMKIVTAQKPFSSLENTNRHKDGHIVILETGGVPVFHPDGQFGGYRGIDRDITDRKQAEAVLKKYSETLEEMVAERTKDLREAHEQLVKKEKLAVLGKLAGGVGHELRNPLGAIKNAAYFLNMVLENPEPDVKETLEIMTREVARSEDILSSLLDFARPTVLTLRKVRINDVLAEAVTRNPIPENIALTRTPSDTLPDIMADPDKLLQVFTNLITNACQAMPAGGSLTIQSAVSGEDRVRVSVTDTGTGITEEHMKRLFEPLFSTKAKGIGLGLVVTKAIVEAHQGSIDVRSEPGKGTTFTVTLPVGIKGGS